MTHVVQLDHVFRVYPTEDGGSAALQGLTFTVREGEIVVVFGPSGSGKTTMLRILAGFDRPSAGRVDVLGVDLRRLGRRRLDVAKCESPERCQLARTGHSRWSDPTPWT